MNKLSTLLLVALGLAGCAAVPVPANGSYGNFVTTADADSDKAMADDVARKLVALYPPARTRFTLLQATPDTFGTSLIATLRAKGYAMAEFKPAPRPTNSPGVTAVAPEQSADIALAYVVDQPMDADLVRVTVLVNSQSLSRLYQAKEGGVAPAGYWIRKE
ncbi:conjugal transfer protein TrbH [Massilia sp. PWRC2]|uniref:conjugal transfer protein TrbH n=1 Tax=Massilia sp. PWRC2 TaxID=2804626 RepID=UPI003CED2AA0